MLNGCAAIFSAIFIGGGLIALPFIFFGGGPHWSIKWMIGAGVMLVLGLLVTLFSNGDNQQSD